MIGTERLRLFKWEERHRTPFAGLHADAEVMADLGGPIDRAQSELKFDRYLAAQREHGISRFAVESRDESFLGYAGVMPRLSADHPLGPHFEIGWRFVRTAWGKGYATESARAALGHAVTKIGLKDILAYTSADNLRSQAVMRRLDLVRRPALDFRQRTEEGREWQGLVWAVPSD